MCSSDLLIADGETSTVFAFSPVQLSWELVTIQSLQGLYLLIGQHVGASDLSHVEQACKVFVFDLKRLNLLVKVCPVPQSLDLAFIKTRQSEVVLTRSQRGHVNALKC